MKVRFTSSALRQLDAILVYSAEHHPGAAARLQERLLGIFDLLARHPLAGEATSREGQRRMVATPYPYAVFYRVRRDEVMIQRVRNTSRRPLKGTEHDDNRM